MTICIIINRIYIFYLLLFVFTFAALFLGFSLLKEPYAFLFALMTAADLVNPAALENVNPYLALEDADVANITVNGKAVTAKPGAGVRIA